MKNRQTILGILIIAMALGTAWAIRGKFGHEQGAAWAGAIGAIAVILVARRKDWYDKVFKVAFAAAIGWGMGGMISYGVVVGYGRGSDYVNVYYGLLMLFVIGALYGLLGGGLFGLALSDNKETRIKWHTLIVEMVAFGLLTYWLLIDQLEWFMTPPRSEMWASCLGAALALAWYLVRNKQESVLRVSIYAGLGAGFGFAFGNFLQVLGRGSSLPFNFWNIMEYSIGFFGGLGMAYGTLTATWADSSSPVRRRTNLVPILVVVLFIPYVIWNQSFITDKLGFLLTLGGSEVTIFTFQWMSILSILMTAVIVLVMYYRPGYDYRAVRFIFVLYLGLYTFLSFLLTGIITHPIEQYLYLVNMAIILVLLPRVQNGFEPKADSPRKWVAIFVLVMLILAVLAAIAIASHGPLKGSQIRFE